jgi:hypothetical protein
MNDSIRPTDLVALSRRDLSDLLAGVAAATHQASEAYSATADAARRLGQRSAARERERICARQRDTADRLLQAAASVLSSENPAAVLAEAMPLVRESEGKHP